MYQYAMACRWQEMPVITRDPRGAVTGSIGSLTLRPGAPLTLVGIA